MWRSGTSIGDNGTEFTFSDVARETARFARALLGAGFGSADQLLVIGEVRPRLVFATLGALALGGTVMPVAAATSPTLRELRRWGARSLPLGSGTSNGSAMSGYRDRPNIVICEDAAGALGDGVRSYSEFRRSGGPNGATNDSLQLLRDIRGNGGIVLPNHDGSTIALNEATLLSEAYAHAASSQVTSSDDLFISGSLGKQANLLALAHWAVTGFRISFPESALSAARDRAEDNPYLLASSLDYQHWWDDAVSRVPEAGSISRRLVDRVLSSDGATKRGRTSIA